MRRRRSRACRDRRFTHPSFGPSIDDGDGAPVLSVGLFVRAEDRGTLLAVGDRRHAARVDAERDQVVAGRGRATLNERQVVLPGAALVGGSEEHTSELQSLLRLSYAVFCLT